MASVHNYTFDSLSRLGDDQCYVSERSKQNTQYGAYNTTNFFEQNCGLEKTVQLATSMPSVFVNGGFGNSGAGGCNIGSDSNLKIGSIQTNSKCRISLQTRPFLTVPYLGRGPCNPLLETQIQQGDNILNKKSCNTTTEVSHIKYRHYPLVDSIKHTVSNPKNLVEGVAAKGWVQGGLPTRELIRDSNYMQSK